MCRPKSAKGGGRLCSSHSNKALITARNARRRATYTENKSKSREALESNIVDATFFSENTVNETNSLASAVTESASDRSVSFGES